VEEGVVRLLEERGPQTGGELREALGGDGFGLWKTCLRSKRIAVRRVGRRYLRLDQRVDGYARLSPSILREFLTYTVVGLETDPAALAAKTADLDAHIKEISAAKLRLAQRIIGDIGARLLEHGAPAATPGAEAAGEEPGGAQEERFCVLLAGDIVYEMGHDSPRPERSTGRMVRGSDLDLVVIMDDEAPEELAKALDDAIYQQKYRHLINPSFREEIDYTIKPLARLREQAAFDTFKHMVPCKILDEAVLLYGSRRLFRAAKALLKEQHVADALAAMERSAVVARREAEEHLLSRDEGALRGDDLYLFHTSEESEEFE
jgi:hypothetical protein